MKKFFAVVLAACLCAGGMMPTLVAEAWDDPHENDVWVYFSIWGDTPHGEDFDEVHTYTEGNLTQWLTTELWLPKGSTVADLVGQQLEKWGYTQEGLEMDYITSITTPTNMTLASGTNGDASGWQYAYNYRIGDKTMSQQVLGQNAVVMLCYTDDWAAEDYVNSLKEVYEGQTLTGDVAYQSVLPHWLTIYNDEGVTGLPAPITTYALKDENGYETNYVRARELANIMQRKDLSKRFNVSWDQEKGAVLFQSQTDYIAQEGEEELPFSGDRNYTFVTDPVFVDGVKTEIEALLLQDGLGRGYTYYKLRDLGEALGFSVEWNSANGAIILNAPQRVDDGREVPIPPEFLTAEDPPA